MPIADSYTGSNMRTKSSFGDLLRSTMADKGLKQASLADKVGVSQAHLSDIVNAKKQPSAPLVKQFALALDADVDDFLLAAGYAPEGVRGGPALPRELLDLPEPPDEEEIAIVRMIGAADEGPFALKAGVAFWTEPRAARLRRLRFEADEWRDRQAKAQKPNARDVMAGIKPKATFQKTAVPKIQPGQEPRTSSAAGEPYDDPDWVQD